MPKVSDKEGKHLIRSINFPSRKLKLSDIIFLDVLIFVVIFCATITIKLILYTEAMTYTKINYSIILNSIINLKSLSILYISTSMGYLFCQPLIFFIIFRSSIIW